MFKHPKDRSSRPTKPFFKEKNMAKIIGGALSLGLTILVLRLVLPEISQGLIDIVVKLLLIVGGLLDSTGNLAIQIQ